MAWQEKWKMFHLQGQLGIYNQKRKLVAILYQEQSWQVVQQLPQLLHCMIHQGQVMEKQGWLVFHSANFLQ
jgi:hypothetical protein